MRFKCNTEVAVTDDVIEMLSKCSESDCINISELECNVSLDYSEFGGLCICATIGKKRS